MAGSGWRLAGAEGARVSGLAAAGLGALELGTLIVLGWWPGARDTPFPAVVLFCTAFLSYLVAARLQTRSPLARRHVWVLGLLARAALLPLLPYFSDDIYRYMWDGWVQLQGVNPFLHPPAATTLEPIRTSWQPLINHPSVATIYPPGAQLVFRALSTFGPSILIFKLAWIACDLGVARIIDRLTRDRSDGLPLLLYLWSPLLLVEVAWSGHLEPLAILPVMLAVWFDQRSDRSGGRFRSKAGFAAGAFLGLGASLKLAPAAAIPVLGRRQTWTAMLVALTIPLLLYLPYADAGAMLFSGLREYADRWEFNAGAYRLLVRAAGSAPIAKALGAAAVASVVIEAARRRWPLDRALLWIVGAALLLSPTVHPWYVLWALPFAVLRGVRGWIALTGLVFLAYWGLGTYQTRGTWLQPAWIPWVVYIPVYLLLAHDALRAQRFTRCRHMPGRQQDGERSQSAARPEQRGHRQG
jgi:alpha-1,6-mannosyltransferase